LRTTRDSRAAKAPRLAAGQVQRARSHAARGVPALPREYLIGLSLATLSGCLWFLSCAPFDLSFFSWVAMVPLLFAVERAPTRAHAILFGWWTGIVGVGGGFYWMIELLRRFASVSLPVATLLYLLFSAYQGSVFLFFAWMVRAIHERKAFSMALLAPICMVVAELFVPLLFPSHLAIVQAWHPIVIQISDITGPMGVTALLVMVNGAIYGLLTRGRRGAVPAFASVLVLAASLLYGHYRMKQVDALSASAPKLTVGLVQPNVAYNIKGVLHPERAQAQLAVQQAQSQKLAGAGAQLIVWTEGSYPFVLPRDFSQDFPAAAPYSIHRGFDTPVLIGALTRAPLDVQYHNSALLIAGNGQVEGRYDKMRLLAFGEQIPGLEWFPWLRKYVPNGTGAFLAGAKMNTVDFAWPDGSTVRLGAIICYEDILPEFLRSIGALHPHLLVNLTNDTWFGEKAEPWQHLALAVFASVEQRTGMVRAVNSGVSAVIDANGRVVQQSYAVDPYYHPTPASTLLADVALLEGGHTVYQAVGNLFAYLCVFMTVLLWLTANQAFRENFRD
jgi:apolipoprotein N-acyltransferase